MSYIEIETRSWVTQRGLRFIVARPNVWRVVRERTEVAQAKQAVRWGRLVAYQGPDMSWHEVAP